MSKYSKHFKLKAVNAYLSQAVGLRQVAASFSIQPSQLRGWLSVYKHQGADALAPRKTQQEYSTTFKLSVLNYKRLHDASFPQVAVRFHIPSPSTIFVWEQRYNQGGINALANCRGRPRMKKPKNPTDPQIATKPWSELTPKELLREIEYLQAENAYLKKLDALIHEKKLTQKIKPTPSKD
jgi:transposase